MNSYVSKMKDFALLAVLLTGFIACGVGGDTGRLSMSLTDKPTNEYTAVYITIKEIAIHAAGDAEGSWTKVLDVNKTFNLMALANGVREQLGIVSLDPGHYTQMRLIIGPDAIAPYPFANYVVDTKGDIHEMKIPSGFQTGIKLVQGFDINQNSTTELIFDFDASRSVVVAGNSGKYLLKPTIHMIDDSAVRTVINGTVTTVENVGLAGANVSVQVYNAGATDPKDKVVVWTSTLTDSAGAYALFFSVPQATTFNLVATNWASTDKNYAPDWDQIPDAIDGNAYTRNFTLPVPVQVGTVDITIGGAGADMPVTLSFRQISDLAGTPVVEVKSVNYVNGTYKLDLPVGEYTVVASTPDKSSLELPLTMTKTPSATLNVSFPL